VLRIRRVGLDGDDDDVAFARRVVHDVSSGPLVDQSRAGQDLSGLEDQQDARRTLFRVLDAFVMVAGQ
jgi:hypothetical protein